MVEREHRPVRRRWPGSHLSSLSFWQRWWIALNHFMSFSFTQWIFLRIFPINIFQNIRQWTFSQWRHWTSASPQSSKCKWKLTLTLSLTAGSPDDCFTHTQHSLVTRSSVLTRFLSIQMRGWSGSIMVDQKRNWSQRGNTVGSAA